MPNTGLFFRPLEGCGSCSALSILKDLKACKAGSLHLKSRVADALSRDDTLPVTSPRSSHGIYARRYRNIIQSDEGTFIQAVSARFVCPRAVLILSSILFCSMVNGYTQNRGASPSVHFLKEIIFVIYDMTKEKMVQITEQAKAYYKGLFGFLLPSKGRTCRPGWLSAWVGCHTPRVAGVPLLVFQC